MRTAQIITFCVFLLTSNLGRAECDFIHGNNRHAVMNPQDVREIRITVPKSAKYAENFLKIISTPTQNIPPTLKKKFKANIEVVYGAGSCRFKGSIKQNGDWRDHIDFKNGTPTRSLNVKLKNGNILGAVKFKLLLPETRNGLNEILGSLIYRQLGYIAPETFLVNTVVNGVDSVMLFQEDAQKELLERSGRREGPIYEGDETLLWSEEGRETNLDPIALARVVNTNWMFRGDSSISLGLQGLVRLQNGFLSRGSLTSSEMKMRSQQPLTINGARSKTELDYQFTTLIMNGTHGLTYHNRKWYLNSFKDMLEPIYYDGNLNLQKKIQPSTTRTYYFSPTYTYPHFALLKSPVFQNELAELFYSRVTTDDDKVADFFNSSIKILLENASQLQEAVSRETNFQLISELSTLSNKSYIELASELGVDQTIIEIDTLDPLNLIGAGEMQKTLTDEELSDLVSSSKLNGKRAILLPSQNYFKGSEIFTEILPFGSNGPKITHSPGITVASEADVRTFRIVQKDPTAWILVQGGRIPDDWNFDFVGAEVSEEFTPSAQRFNRYGLTGCLNFYDVTFSNNNIFASNGGCEDGLNIVSSRGDLNEIYVSNALADAVDIDFSDLSIGTSRIERAGNDCFDVSGGQYKSGKLIAEQCSDKGLSVGENSEFSLHEFRLKDAVIGVSSKDLSDVSIDRFSGENVMICAEVRQKKQEFGGGRLVIREAFCSGTYEADNTSVLKVVEGMLR